MTIDEAIIQEIALAENQEDTASAYHNAYYKFGGNLYMREETKCRECVEEHRQLAEWLKELKAFRQAYDDIRHLTISWEEGIGIEKCIEIIEKCLGENDEAVL